MFFIGGLNSVLPFILYVSLIWICMVIGFGNKLRIVMRSQVLPVQTIQRDDPASSAIAFVLEPETKVHALRINRKKTHFADLPKKTRHVVSRIFRLTKTCGTNQQIASFSVSNAYRGPPLG